MPFPAKQDRFTYADCLTWGEDTRAELIDGEALMLASPSGRHQEISMEISRQLANYLEGKRCRVYPAPLDVRLFERAGDRPEDVDTVVVPDISVVCDRDRIDQRGCRGAPDMIVEILSPSTLRRDRLVKLNLYQRAGVREYWIVDPENRAVQVFLLEGGALRIREEYGPGDAAKVNVLEGCFVDLSKVFPD